MAKIVTKVGIEEDGLVIIPPGKFDEIIPVVFDNGEISDKLFLVKECGDNDIVLITKNSEAGYLRYCDVNRIGFINKHCIAVSVYSERHGEKWALIRTETIDKITEYSYDSISLINEDMYMTEKEGLFGVIDKNGDVILPNKFTEISFEGAHNTFIVKPYTSEE